MLRCAVIQRAQMVDRLNYSAVRVRECGYDWGNPRISLTVAPFGRCLCSKRSRYVRNAYNFPSLLNGLVSIP